jgi:hypothetical protein
MTENPPRTPSTEADMLRLLDRLYEQCRADDKLPNLFAAIIDRLFNSDPDTAMIIIKTLLDEAMTMLPEEERDALLREFSLLANPN